MGGGAPDAVLRSLPTDIAGINKLSKDVFGLFQGDIANDPILSKASSMSQSLMQFGQDKILPGAMKMFDVGMNTVLPGGLNVLGFGQDFLNAGKGDILDTIKNHGALSGWQERDVAGATQSAAAGMGMGHSLGTLGQRLMNRGAMQEHNVNQAYARAGQAANIGQTTLAAPGMALPYLTAPGQAVGSTIQPGLATEQTAASTYNPQILGSMNFIQDFSDFNANAQNAAEIAGSNKSAGLMGGGISAGGSILAAAIPAIIGL